MFCRKCGANVDNGSMFCPYCGTQMGTPDNTAQQQQQPYYQNPQQQYYQAPQQYNQTPAQQQNTLAIVGFILSFFIPIAGLICSILGFKASKLGAPHGGLAKAGIIISAVSLGLTVFIWIIYGSMIGAMLSGLYYCVM